MPSIKKNNNQQNKIKVPSENNVQLNYPVFCFRHLQPLPNKDHKFYCEFIERLKKLSNLDWKTIDVTQKHSFGTEKIPISQIKPQLPNFVTPEITHLLVFRANGDNRPFLGLRNGSIFHIVFIEERFNDIYNH